METNEAVPEEIEDEPSEPAETRDWTDYDDDGQLIAGCGDEEWY